MLAVTVFSNVAPRRSSSHQKKVLFKCCFADTEQKPMGLMLTPLPASLCPEPRHSR